MGTLRRFDLLLPDVLLVARELLLQFNQIGPGVVQAQPLQAPRQCEAGRGAGKAKGELRPEAFPEFKEQG